MFPNGCHANIKIGTPMKILQESAKNVYVKYENGSPSPVLLKVIGTISIVVIR